MPKNKLYKSFKNYKYQLAAKDESAVVYSEEVKDDKFLKLFTDDYSSLVRIFKIWNQPDIKN